MLRKILIPWALGTCSKTVVSSMSDGDFFGSEKSYTCQSDTNVNIILKSTNGDEITLKENISLIRRSHRFCYIRHGKVRPIL